MEDHDVHVHPGRSNTSDFEDTEERFGTVDLIGTDLKERICAIEVSEDVHLTEAQKYMCENMGIPLPVLPLVSEEEKKLFNTLVLTSNDSSSLDFGAFAMTWCDHVDGIKVFPKHTFHLKAYHTKWMKGQKAKATMRKMEAAIKQIREDNEATSLYTFSFSFISFIQGFIIQGDKSSWEN